MDKPIHSSLTLGQAGTARRVDALFRAMSSDYLLREQFITDPSQILSEYVAGKKLPPDEALQVNHLIYSVMSSKDMVKWLRDRAFQRGESVEPSGGLLAEFSRAAVQNGDHGVVHSLIHNPAASSKLSDFHGLLLSEIVRNIVGLQDGTEMSTGGGGTQQSGTHTTEHSTGGGGTRGWIERAAEEEREALLLQADGTEMSTGGGGTQQSGTHTTEHSTGGGGTRGWIERAAEEEREALLLQADGTEMSTGGGGGTQQSGTHTTEHSTGGGGTRGWLGEALFGDGHAMVTLEALSLYASNLQKRGLLANIQRDF